VTYSQHTLHLQAARLFSCFAPIVWNSLPSFVLCSLVLGRSSRHVRKTLVAGSLSAPLRLWYPTRFFARYKSVTYLNINHPSIHSYVRYGRSAGTYWLREPVLNVVNELKISLRSPTVTWALTQYIKHKQLKLESPVWQTLTESLISWLTWLSHKMVNGKWLPIL